MKTVLKQLGMIGLAMSAWSCSRDPELPQDVAQAMTKLPAKLDYNLHVKPILSDRCFACHGPDKAKQKGDLRLDLPVAYEKVAESGRKAIVPGSLANSEVIHRILSTDPDVMMPTPESHLSLTAEEKATLIRWIDEGAAYKKHWSLVAPQKPELPVVNNKTWAKNPIDRFVLAKQEEKGLSPAPEASRETLIRRLSFDLTGLPPSITEIDNFLADKSPNAYEKVVNRLLASPHFGERLAVDWLDAARYADTHGYQDDGFRNVYPWRNWVINAFNHNLPYDKFITWQLAGDLLPNRNGGPTGREQIMATAFLRNHPQSQEGGIVDEEYRTEYVLDRVSLFGKAFLAFSVECARCHDHKYDPITQKNFYQLAAFFNNNNETGQIPYHGEASPSVLLTTPETEKLVTFMQTQIQSLEATARNRASYQPAFDKWLAQASRQPGAFSPSTKGLLGHFTLDDNTIKNEITSPLQAQKPKTGASKTAPANASTPVLIPGKFGKALLMKGDMAVTFNEHMNFERNEPFSIALWVNVRQAGEKGPLFSRTSGDLDGWRGYYGELNADQTVSIKLNHVFPDNCIHIRTNRKLTPSQWHHLVLTYDGSSKATGLALYRDGEKEPLKVITDNLRQSILFSKDRIKPYNFANFKLGSELRASIANVAFDELLVYNRPLAALEIKQLFTHTDAIGPLLTTPASQLTASQKAQLFEYYVLTTDEQYAKNQVALKTARGRENDILTDQDELMVYKELKTPRPTFLLDRGVYDAPKERVYPNTPESILPFDQRYPKNRLGLSQWLLSDDQPLFARVAVNRFWQQCFGQGLTKTADDFGNQGELPTHLELLDWLAIRFREGNGQPASRWNVKELLKTIVMSATYRQSSLPGRQTKELDPDNRLLTRAPSYRMSAEMIRDNALTASGLLVKKVGGKSVHPYQPDGVWEALAVRNVTKYNQGVGDDLYRRSLYTVWKRSSPNPAMITFDVPDRYACTVRRQKTSTPLQSLVLLNDVQYVEAGRMLAERMLREGGSRPEDWITYAFRSLTSRRPRPDELRILLNLYQQQYTDFQKNPARAKSLLTEGEHVASKTLPVTELATCAVLANALMNFDEFTIKR
jgi:hypothetical protein